MLHENIRSIRKARGLSQEELAAKLHVVRQTISKWETGLSVPDADLLIALSEVLQAPVSTLLGETMDEPKPDDWNVISEKLEDINLQLAQRKTARREMLHWGFIALCVLIVLAFAAICALNSPYLGWDYSKPETEVMGVGLHALEWLFVRAAPFALVGAAAGAFATRRRRPRGRKGR